MPYIIELDFEDGKLTDKKGTLVGGIYQEDGTPLYYGLHKGFSGGFQHVAACQQDAEQFLDSFHSFPSCIF